MNAEQQTEKRRQSDWLYATYVKPLERDHTGEYVAVAPDGRLVLAPDLLTLADRAVETFGPGGFAFKVGELSVGRWR